MLSADISLEDQLFFDNLYGRFTDMEKKIFMKSFLEEGNIYEAEQEDGRILRSHKLRFPVFFNEQELYELDWDNESTVESVLLTRRAVEEHILCHKGAYTGKSGITRDRTGKPWYHRNLKR